MFNKYFPINERNFNISCHIIKQKIKQLFVYMLIKNGRALTLFQLILSWYN